MLARMAGGDCHLGVQVVRNLQFDCIDAGVVEQLCVICIDRLNNPLSSPLMDTGGVRITDCDHLSAIQAAVSQHMQIGNPTAADNGDVYQHWLPSYISSTARGYFDSTSQPSAVISSGFS